VPYCSGRSSQFLKIKNWAPPIRDSAQTARFKISMINETIPSSKKLSKFPDIVQGILVGRLMFYNNDPKEVVANRKRAFTSLGIDLKKVVIQRQEHGNKARVITGKDRGAGVFDPKTYLKGTDGMITKDKGVFLVVHTADCVPISFYDPKKKIVAIAHAGWKGTIKRIGEKTVLEMKEVFRCDLKNIIAYIGPSIEPCCYRIENRDKKIIKFKKAFPGCVYEKLNRIYLDLWKANKKQLLEAGVLEKNIEESKVCTYCSKLDLPSHYREGEERNRSILSVIGRR